MHSPQMLKTRCFLSFSRRLVLSLLTLTGGLSALAEPMAWVNVTNDLGGSATTWGRINTITMGAAPGTDTVYIHVGGVGIFSSKDGGAHWVNTESAPETSPINGFVSNFVFDPKDPKTFWIGCWYGKGLFKTTDAGKTFQQLGTMDHVEGVTVDFTDPQRKTIAFGRHEKPQSLMLSKDGGASWKAIGANIPPETNFSTFPLLLGPNTLLSNTSGWGKAPINGIWRSENAGETWTKVSDLFPNGIPTLTSKGSIFYPVKNGLARSTDGGKTWELLKSPTAYSIIELPDGRLAGKGWAAGGSLQISTDNGTTWTPYGPKLPATPAEMPSLVYLPGMKAFMICVRAINKKIPDAVWRLDVR